MERNVSLVVLICIFLNVCLPELKGQKGQPNLLVFAGEKISIERLSKEFEFKNMTDFAFLAKYKVIHVVSGEYNSDTIQFEVHDHYGFPVFGKFKNVLLYLSQTDSSKWYHQKYMYSDIYPTMDGRWAGPYNASDYSRIENKSINIKPENIQFKDSIWVDISWINKYKPKIAKRTLKEWYPEPYYQIRSDSAYVQMGNYIEDLLQIQRYGVLEARGIKW